MLSALKFIFFWGTAPDPHTGEELRHDVKSATTDVLSRLEITTRKSSGDDMPKRDVTYIILSVYLLTTEL